MNVLSEQDLRLHTTIKVPVTARFFAIVKSKEEIIEAQKFAQERSVPLYVLGGGSNTVFVTDRYDGLVIKNMGMNISESPTERDLVDVKVSSGYPMTAFVNYTIEHGLEGMEYQMGLPGSIGGAVYMNSKWTKPLSYVGDTLVSATVLTQDGTLKTVDREYFKFAYDYSFLQETHEILIDVTFRLKKSDNTELKKRAEAAQEHRKKTQPSGVFTSGCFFQNLSEQEMKQHNLTTQSAGALIDRAGLKGTRIGQFIVSPMHANFIVHEGNGKAEDLKNLIQQVKQKVKETYNIDLKEEVRVVDN